MTKRLVAMAACCLALACAGGARAQLAQGYPIVAADAQRMAQACVALAQRSGWTMQVAILDEHGDLVRFERMDGARRATGTIALEKARSAFRTGRTTRELQQMDPSGQRLFDAVTIPGGLVLRDGIHEVAYVGVSGSKPDNDEACAAQALAAMPLGKGG
jgi:uncharacterized protein GlcG (DUF336 family)